MITNEYECSNRKVFVNTNDELKSKCCKEYCLCEDKYIWDNEKDKKYQKAKKEGKAVNGIFLK